MCIRARALLVVVAALVADAAWAYTASQYISNENACITFSDPNWDTNSSDFTGSLLGLSACKDGDKAQAWTVNAGSKGSSGELNIWGGKWAIGPATADSLGTPQPVKVVDPTSSGFDASTISYQWTSNSQFKDAAGQMCLSAANGSTLVAAECDNTDPKQIWEVRNQANSTDAGNTIVVGPAAAVNESDTARMIHFLNRTDLCLTAQGDQTQGVVGIQYCSSVGSNTILFDFDEDNDFTTIQYTAPDNTTKMCLVVYGDGNGDAATSGSMVQSRPCGLTDEFGWKMTEYARIQWRSDTSLCMDVQEGSDGSSDNQHSFQQLVQVWEDVDDDGQQLWSWTAKTAVSRRWLPEDSLRRWGSRPSVGH